MTPGRWRKSSRSGGHTGNCVEVRWSGPVEVRDSKAPALGSLAVDRADFTALLTALR
ncbi:uncharacterized protein DUF397 [Stackebrandtia albiflava]|uniref:Uncharacterized protein DUF397 n=1 Tax=Stackebrandtia albiflava TaxID=406432 RepID=A0A562UQ90_9ACTN|nr:DUF397 domain-containing protein [Stackebrandtia albiflava]TWJ07795.1 uncharacterized protein DUF397 [Stackebrandtia albiflava]